MKDVLISKTLDKINYNHKYTKDELEVIEYGLTSLYLLFTKLIVLIFLANELHVLKEFFLFSLFYNIIRMPSFGIHATKSWICLIFSILVFIGIPLISYIYINNYLKLIIGIISIISFIRNAPADTLKRPIVSRKRRFIYKILSIMIAILYLFLSLVLNGYLSNLIFFALVIQSIIISRMIYIITGQPYNNGLNVNLNID